MSPLDTIIHPEYEDDRGRVTTKTGLRFVAPNYFEGGIAQASADGLCLMVKNAFRRVFSSNSQKYFYIETLLKRSVEVFRAWGASLTYYGRRKFVAIIFAVLYRHAVV